MTQLLDGLAGGWVSLFAIIVLWAETAILSLLSRAPQRRFRALFANACSGTCLLAALAVALRDGDPVWILVLLVGSLIAHGADIVMRGGGHVAEFSRRTE
jgi:hypothetical protein